MTALSHPAFRIASGRAVTRADLVPFTDPLRVPPVLRPRWSGTLGVPLTVRAQPAWVTLHSQLPRTLVWAYDGHFPGPTIEVRRGERLRVAWRNELSGAVRLASYDNDQPASGLWYHDQAMVLTVPTVMTGLTGAYLIRDEVEDALQLPHGGHEVPLLLADRDIPSTGSFTLVNGAIWPYLAVEPRWYRFRLVNASDARVYRLGLVDVAGGTVPGAMYQIGSDGGLLPAPVPLESLTLAPAERADVLIDFRALAGGSLRLLDTAPGATPEPGVMKFRVGTRPVRDTFTLPAVLDPGFVRLDHDTAPGHQDRWAALIPADPAGGGDPELWELAELAGTSGVPVPSDGIIQVREADGTVRTFRRTARTSTDQLDLAGADAGQQWSVLNLGGRTRPVHLHEGRFQALSRAEYTVADGGVPRFDAAVGGTVRPVGYADAGTLDANEQGWKDVIRVGAGDLVRIAAGTGDRTADV